MLTDCAVVDDCLFEIYRSRSTLSKSHDLSTQFNPFPISPFKGIPVRGPAADSEMVKKIRRTGFGVLFVFLWEARSRRKFAVFSPKFDEKT